MRWVVGGGVTMLAVAAAVLAWMWGASTGSTRSDEAPQVVSGSPPVFTEPAEPAVEADPSAPPPARPSAPTTPYEEALLAVLDHTEQGFVRCTLPPDLTLNMKMLPWSRQDGRLLTLVVQGERGVVPLYGESLARPDAEPATPPVPDNPSLPPLPNAKAYATFTLLDGATEGTCEVVAASDLVPIHVLVRWPSGETVEGALVSGLGWPAQSDASGRARIDAIPGRELTIRATQTVDTMDTLEALAANAPMLFARGETTLIASAGAEVTIEISEEEEATSGVGDPLGRVADQREQRWAALNEALKQPNLSAQAIAQIRAWHDEAGLRQDDAEDMEDQMNEIRDLVQEMLDDEATREVLERASALE